MVRINPDPIYWKNIVSNSNDTIPDSEDLQKVIRPIIENLNNYKNKLRKNPSILDCYKRSLSVLEYYIEIFDLVEDPVDFRNKIKSQYFTNKEHIINKKKYEFEEILDSKNLVVCSELVHDKIEEEFSFNNVQCKIEFRPLKGDYVTIDIKTTEQESISKSLFSGKSILELVEDENTTVISQEENSRRSKRIKIRYFFPKENSMLIDSLNLKQFKIKVMPNTSVIEKKVKALLSLIERPSNYYLPLLKLFQKHDNPQNEFIFKQDLVGNDEWHYLNDMKYPGVEQQREFVNIALNTPDFALMEGPPGSGKTTTILEILHQFTKRGKKLLLVASTHVAVDNVLERIDSEREKNNELHIFPIRIGLENDVSGVAQDYLYERISEKETKRLLKNLKEIKPNQRTNAQKELIANLESGNNYLNDYILDLANVVCGTTIGILQYPDFRNVDFSINEPFDVMIIDEASKTTLQEFLVPALLAKRWIIIGDKMQLSPFTEEGEIKALWDRCNINNNFEKFHSDICLNCFLANKGNVIITSISSYENLYREQLNQLKEKDLIIINKQKDFSSLSKLLISLIAAKGAIIDYNFFNNNKNIELFIDALPLDLKIIIDNNIINEINRNLLPKLEKIMLIQQNRFNYYKQRNNSIKKSNVKYESWIDAITWRLNRIYELRHEIPNSENNNTYLDDIEELLPKWKLNEINDIEHNNNALDQIYSALRIKSYNLPNVKPQQNVKAILESLKQISNPKEFFEKIKNYQKSDNFSFSYLINEIIWYMLKMEDKDSKKQFIVEFIHQYPELFQDLLTYSVGNVVFDTLRIEFPSIIELLQEGLMVIPKYRNTVIYNCTIYKGYNAKMEFWRNREIKLEYQHRMHPDISKFIRENFYNGKQVKDPDGSNGTYNIIDKRYFTYRKNIRNFWINVNGAEQSDNNSPKNLKEIDEIYKEYCQFENWAQNNSNRENNGIWEVAILTFYKGQERALSEKFRNHFKSIQKYNFKDLKKNIKVSICTVDSFQGQEADVVFLSFVRTKNTGFLDSKNRLNVALSRAKYMQVLVGNKSFFSKERIKDKSPILYTLSNTVPEDYKV